MTTFSLIPEQRRQVAKIMTFPAEMAPYVNWQALADARAELNSDMHVVRNPDNSLTVELSWHYSEEE
jgi:hypothetical protein